MGLFYEVLSAINNPNQKATISQLSSLTNSIQELAQSQGIESGLLETMMGTIGSFVRPVLQQQRGIIGSQNLESLISQAVSEDGLGALASKFTPELQQQMITSMAQITGLNSTTLQTVVNSLIPLVMNLLNMGTATMSGKTHNNILATFLDTDNDQDVNLPDVIKFTHRFLNPPS